MADQILQEASIQLTPVIAALLVCGVVAIFAMAYAFHGLGSGLSIGPKNQTPAPAAPGLASDRKRLDAAVRITDVLRFRQ
jgi:hypothetical protein